MSFSKICVPSFRQPPPTGTIKLNVDASVHPDLEFYVIGGVFRDIESIIIGTFSKLIRGSFSPQWLGCFA